MGVQGERRNGHSVGTKRRDGSVQCKSTRDWAGLVSSKTSSPELCVPNKIEGDRN